MKKKRPARLVLPAVAGVKQPLHPINTLSLIPEKKRKKRR